VDGTAREVVVGTKKNVGSRKNALARDLMTYINDAHFRIAAEDDAFHCRNVVVTKSEVGQ
jgi:hypothetical protein